MPFGGPQLWPLMPLGLLKQLKSLEIHVRILQRRDSPESSPTFSRKNSVRGPNTSSRWRPFGSSRAWWNPWAMLSNAGPAAGGAEHKASCQKRDFASSTRPGESTWDRRLIPWWSDEKYLENTKLLWLQWMAPDFVDTRDHWNSGVRVERTKKNCRRIDDEVGGTSILDQRSDRVHWYGKLRIWMHPGKAQKSGKNLLRICLSPSFSHQLPFLRPPTGQEKTAVGHQSPATPFIGTWIDAMTTEFHTWGWVKTLVPLVNPKIAGKWMFIPLKMVLIGIDPYPHCFETKTMAMTCHDSCHAKELPSYLLDVEVLIQDAPEPGPCTTWLWHPMGSHCPPIGWVKPGAVSFRCTWVSTTSPGRLRIDTKRPQ